VRPTFLGLGIAILLTTGGCTGTPPAPVATGAAASSATAATPIASASTSATRDPDPPGTSAPAKTSGDLTSTELPAPDEVGRGWMYRIEGSDNEDGPGNGSPYQERDPGEVATTTLPLGCQQRSALPRPARVLQATYRSEDATYAVALRLRFDSAAQARQFKDNRDADLRACLGQPDDPYSGTAAPVQSVDTSPRTTRTTYQYPGDARPWTSLLVHAEADVLTLDANPAEPNEVKWTELEAWLQ
jgi:hypothetical protein